MQPISVLVLQNKGNPVVLPHALALPGEENAHVHREIVESHGLGWMDYLPVEPEKQPFARVEIYPAALAADPAKLLRSIKEGVTLPDPEEWLFTVEAQRKPRWLDAFGTRIQRMVRDCVRQMLRPDYKPPGPFAWSPDLLPDRKFWEEKFKIPPPQGGGIMRMLRSAHAIAKHLTPESSGLVLLAEHRLPKKGGVGRVWLCPSTLMKRVELPVNYPADGPLQGLGK